MRCTKPMIQEFAESHIWQDMLEMFEVWMQAIHIQLEDREGITPENVIRRLQGNAETLRRVMNAPEWLIAYIDGKEEEHGS